ncbi:MAG: PorT family protein [Bacteroidota bacterium]|nr:PorT family protein [Bacteroidota bacterium]
MPRFYPLLLTLLLGAATASAQHTYRLGVRGGLNRALSTVEPSNTSPSSAYYYSASKSALYAWQAGAVLEVAFRHVALQPALVFSQKGEQFDAATSINGFAGVSSTETSTLSRYNWLELPVNVVYTLHGFQVFAGPYVALGLGGRQHGTLWQSSPAARFRPYDFDGKIRYGADTENRRVDAGVNFGLGYRKGPLQMQLGYGLGLRNLHQPMKGLISENPYYHDFNADRAYNRVAQLTATYFFEL